MDLGNVLKNQPTAATAPMPKANSNDMDVVEFADHGSFNTPMFLLWLCAIVAILASVFFWLLNQSAVSALEDKNAEKDSTIAEITSSSNLSTEKQATSLLSAVTQLKAANSERYLMNKFLPLFYGRINKNVTLVNLAISSDGKVSLDGTTDSYKSAAAQLLTLKEWKISNKNLLSNVELLSVSEDVTNGVVVKFAITGTLNKTISLPTDSTTTTTGGTSE